ncbi:protein kinase subdomain-containing protein PKL/ccin4 [Coprinopsis cinerea okayama7|uniref:Protein kinase subdomain-containing protein PKL/ccin4 n=1 Tax=Coprinopsis cinerea (strain Okayama-7 / 130 / ATCC MYA-4618 / FGSC 9003) TaxID=240176 RepID=A8NDF5_COPC7|nr:protein kinase subdomain-containing protein PKL/ccin4 [Coprinopsis cinerea okayama7\|eukprot:XP_001832760.1 protein kinase subdomain-containing protein PKL/ccin4 [Coprinopsis cinerea okayama7\
MSKGLRAASKSIPEGQVISAAPHDLLPIHEFAPNEIPPLKTRPTVRIGDILYWLANTIVSRLPDPKPGKDIPTPPSSHTQVHPYSSKPFQSPDLHLTRELLDTTVTIEDELKSSMAKYTVRVISGYDEGEFTTMIVGPLVWTFFEIFELVAGLSEGWHVAPPLSKEDLSGNKLELDTLLQNKDGVVTAIEMKTPRSCNDSNIDSFPLVKPASMDKTARQIHDQVGKQGKYLKGLHPEKGYVLHGLSVAPAHLIPLASSGSRCFAVGTDVVSVSGSFPEVVRDAKNWVEYIDKLAAFTLAIVCHHDRNTAKGVGSRFPEQKKQIDELHKAASKALELTFFEALFNVISTCLCYVQLTLSLPLLLLAQRLQWFRPINSLKPMRCNMVSLNSSWLSLGLKLPDACSVYESYENIVYVHSRWGIRLVIKVFGEQSSYAKELLCYTRLEKQQGKGIPVLYATGTLNARPCLVLSFEGERLRTGPTEEEKVSLYPVLQAMHNIDVHHHDLHRRNVVRNQSGKLTLIDFGLSERCTREGCVDEWLPDE